jgi:hypothetical protein
MKTVTLSDGSTFRGTVVYRDDVLMMDSPEVVSAGTLKQTAGMTRLEVQRSAVVSSVDG